MLFIFRVSEVWIIMYGHVPVVLSAVGSDWHFLCLTRFQGIPILVAILVIHSEVFVYYCTSAALRNMTKACLAHD